MISDPSFLDSKDQDEIAQQRYLTEQAILEDAL